MNFNLKKEDREIDGLRVKTQQLPAMSAFQLLARLVKTVGPALGALMKLDPSTELDGAGMELAGAFSSIDPDEAARLVPEVLAGTTIEYDGKWVPLATRENVNLVFSGKLKTLFAVLGFVLQVNYRDFMQGSGPSAPRHPERSEG